MPSLRCASGSCNQRHQRCHAGRVVLVNNNYSLRHGTPLMFHLSFLHSFHSYFVHSTIPSIPFLPSIPFHSTLPLFVHSFLSALWTNRLVVSQGDQPHNKDDAPRPGSSAAVVPSRFA